MCFFDSGLRAKIFCFVLFCFPPLTPFNLLALVSGFRVYFFSLALISGPKCDSLALVSVSGHVSLALVMVCSFGWTFSPTVLSIVVRISADVYGLLLLGP